MKNIITLALLVAGAAVTANAQSIISWKDNNGTTIPATGYAGVVSATNWNVNTGSANLSYNDASLSGTTLSLAGGVGQWGIGGAVQDPNGSYNSALFSGYYNTGTSETLSLTGISYSLYNVIVYFSSDTDGRTGTISDGATTYSFSTDTRAKVDAHSNFVFAQTTDTGLSHPSADYAVFSGLTGASETLTIANASGGMGIAGVQIVAAPEPGTMALAALGGASLLFWRRRSK